jgi:tRNA uridine 5-carbamoylmethylation protein Kti12
MIYLIRGLPGSGKSSYAKGLNCYHLEADMFLIRDGVYSFDYDRIGDAHNWCLDSFKNAVDMGVTDIVVSNTFIRRKDILPYIEYINGLKYRVIRMTNDYGDIHNVPKDILFRMKERFEDIDDEILLR